MVALAKLARDYGKGPVQIREISQKAYRPCEFCKDETTCQIKKVFKEILTNTNSILQKATLETPIQH
jgi:DNA-binding IscR family transcriptional regulator